MRNLILILAAFVALCIGFGIAGLSRAEADEYCTSARTCRAQVAYIAHSQDRAAAGAQWGPVSQSACARASREQEGNERRCRLYDQKPGGKTLEECAKCYRQVREDLARWEQCHEEGYAPRPPQAIYESLARLGRSAISAM